MSIPSRLPDDCYIVAFVAAFDDEAQGLAKGRDVFADMIAVDEAESHNAAAKLMVERGYGANFAEVFWPTVKIRNDLKAIRLKRSMKRRA